jgi:hypothetical protein
VFSKRSAGRKAPPGATELQRSTSVFVDDVRRSSKNKVAAAADDDDRPYDENKTANHRGHETRRDPTIKLQKGQNASFRVGTLQVLIFNQFVRSGASSKAGLVEPEEQAIRLFAPTVARKDERLARSLVQVRCIWIHECTGNVFRLGMFQVMKKLL